MEVGDSGKGDRGDFCGNTRTLSLDGQDDLALWRSTNDVLRIGSFQPIFASY
jgi:hypothetical protein